jgi:hypothetical protein
MRQLGHPTKDLEGHSGLGSNPFSVDVAFAYEEGIISQLEAISCRQCAFCIGLTLTTVGSMTKCLIWETFGLSFVI